MVGNILQYVPSVSGKAQASGLPTCRLQPAYRRRKSMLSIKRCHPHRTFRWAEGTAAKPAACSAPRRPDPNWVQCSWTPVPRPLIGRSDPLPRQNSWQGRATPLVTAETAVSAEPGHGRESTGSSVHSARPADAANSSLGRQQLSGAQAAQEWTEQHGHSESAFALRRRSVG